MMKFNKGIVPSKREISAACSYFQANILYAAEILKPNEII